jgi:NTE family protein
MAQTLGHIFSSAFIDSLESDVNNVIQVNEMLGILANEAPDFSSGTAKPLDLLVIRPSIDLDDLAAQHLQDLPWAFRRVLRGMGAGRAGGGNLASYVMFEAAFCRELIQQGYRDTMAEEDTVRNFFNL